MTTDTNGAGGLPEFVAVGEVIVYDSYRGATLYGAESCALAAGTKLYTADQMRAYGELCRATREGDGEVDVETVRAALKNYMASFGTQKQFATSHGVSESYVSDVLRGHRNVPEEWVCSLGFRVVWVGPATLRTLSRVAVQEGMVLVPEEPAPEWFENVLRVDQPRLKEGCREWNRLLSELDYWHAAIAAAQRQEGGSNG